MTSSSNNPSDIFRERLRTAREELRKLSQADLARETGLPASSVAHFEAGTRKPSFDNLRKLANALNITTDYLLGRSEDPAGAAEADPIYRDVHNLTDKNRKMAADFMRFLAQQDEKERGEDE